MTLRHLVKTLVSGPSKDPGAYVAPQGYPAPGPYVPGQPGGYVPPGPSNQPYNYGSPTPAPYQQQGPGPSGYSPSAPHPPQPSSVFSPPPPNQFAQHPPPQPPGYIPPQSAPPTAPQHFPPPPNIHSPSQQAFPPQSAPPASQHQYGAPPETPGFAPPTPGFPPPAYGASNQQYPPHQEQQQFGAPPAAPSYGAQPHDQQFGQTHPPVSQYPPQSGAPAPFSSPEHQPTFPPPDHQQSFPPPQPSSTFPPHDPHAQSHFSHAPPDHSQTFPPQGPTTYDHSQSFQPQGPPNPPTWDHNQPPPPSHHGTFNMNSMSQALPDQFQQQNQFSPPASQGTFPMNQPSNIPDHSQQFNNPQPQNTFPQHTTPTPPLNNQQQFPPPSHQTTFASAVSPMTPPVHNAFSPPPQHHQQQANNVDHSVLDQNAAQHQSNLHRQDSIYHSNIGAGGQPSPQYPPQQFGNMPVRQDSVHHPNITTDGQFSSYNGTPTQANPPPQYPQYPQSSSPQQTAAAYKPPAFQSNAPAAKPAPAYKPLSYKPDETKKSDGVTVSEKSRQDSMASKARRDSLVGVSANEKRDTRRDSKVSSVSGGYSRTPSPPPKTASPLPYPTDEKKGKAEFPNPISPTTSKPQPPSNLPYPMDGPAVNPPSLPYPTGGPPAKSPTTGAKNPIPTPPKDLVGGGRPSPAAMTMAAARKNTTPPSTSPRPQPHRNDTLSSNTSSVTVDSTPIFVGDEPSSYFNNGGNNSAGPKRPSVSSPSASNSGTFITPSGLASPEYIRILDAVFAHLDSSTGPPSSKGSMNPGKLGKSLYLMGYSNDENIHACLMSVAKTSGIAPPQIKKFVNAGLSHFFELYSFPFLTNINTGEPELSRDGFHAFMLFDSLINPERQRSRLNNLLMSGKVYDFKSESAVREILQEEGKLGGKPDPVALEAEGQKRKMLRGEIEGELRSMIAAGGGHGVEIKLPGDPRR